MGDVHPGGELQLVGIGGSWTRIGLLVGAAVIVSSQEEQQEVVY